MSEEIKKYYKDILPQDVNDEIEDRIRELEVNQEKEIDSSKAQAISNINDLGLFLFS